MWNMTVDSYCEGVEPMFSLSTPPVTTTSKLIMFIEDHCLITFEQEHSVLVRFERERVIPQEMGLLYRRQNCRIFIYYVYNMLLHNNSFVN